MATVPFSNIYISTVTEAELRFGLARLTKPAPRLENLVERFLQIVKILPWDSDAAAHYGLLRARLERDGMTLENLDMMIAAHAMALGAVLVTNDGSFPRIQHLNCEDWTRD
jgi:tRNA(fMet)-specific endonuclease VapC